MTRPAHLLLVSFLLAAPLLAAPPSAPPPPTGTWHAMLVPAEGVEVPFELRVETRGGALSAAVVNGAIESPFTSASWADGLLTLEWTHLDARLTARPEGDRMTGSYVRIGAAGAVSVPFAASRRAPAVKEPPAGAPSVDGEWGITLGAGEKMDRLLGVFREAKGRVTGSALSTSGDYGPLHGTWDGERLVLSVFDGVFIYRLDARRQADGTLAGEFRARASAPVPWTAVRLDAKAADAFLPDGYSALRAKDPSKPFRFAFPDADGKTVSSDGPRLAGKALVVTFSGTWCPNCNDEAPVLEALYRKYRARGLEVVALHFEYTDDAARSSRLLKSFAARYGVTYPLLLAGTTKEAKASPVSLQLEGSRPYPTTLFLDRSHRIVRAHTGFDGPATGDRFAKLKKEMEETVETLLR
jgi:thiol-disulfide isomerase/thioredoxin